MKETVWYKTLAIRMGAVLGLMVIASGGLVAANVIALNSLSVGEAVNEAGKNRMRTFKALYLVHRALSDEDNGPITAAQLREIVDDVEASLTSLIAGDSEIGALDPAIVQDLRAVKSQWDTSVAPLLGPFTGEAFHRPSAGELTSIRSSATAFVAELNTVIGVLAEADASDLATLKALQWIYFAVALALLVPAGLLVLGLRRRVFAMARVAERVTQTRDLEEIDDSEGDELAMLWDNVLAMIRTYRARELEAKQIMDSAADAVICIDQKGTILQVNPATVALFQYSREELIGSNVKMIAASPYAEEHDAYLDRYHKTGEARIINSNRHVEGKKKDGSIVPVALRVSRMQHEEVRYIGILQDITKEQANEKRKAELLEAIKSVVQQLSTSAAQTLSAVTQTAAGAHEQAAVIAETMTAVDEVTQTSAQAAQRANEVAQESKRAVLAGQDGLAAVEKTTEQMAIVNNRVSSLAEIILSLAGRAQSIGEIIDTVNDLAEQTNILSLNAAIEASRAGEHGRGFTVVANEVKTLALQSREATSQVGSILGEIQKATSSAVMSAEQGTLGAAAAIKQVEKAGEIMGRLMDTINAAQRSSTQIAASASQQAVGMSQIADGMVQINGAVEESLKATAAVEQSATDLNALGVDLRALFENGN